MSFNITMDFLGLDEVQREIERLKLRISYNVRLATFGRIRPGTPVRNVVRKVGRFFGRKRKWGVLME